MTLLFEPFFDSHNSSTYIGERKLKQYNFTNEATWSWPSSINQLSFQCYYNSADCAQSCYNNALLSRQNPLYLAYLYRLSTINLQPIAFKYYKSFDNVLSTVGAYCYTQRRLAEFMRNGTCSCIESVDAAR